MIDTTLINPRNLWYVVGLIVTDGNLSKDGRHINITSNHKPYLEEIKKALFISNKITMKGRGGNSAKIYSFLQFGDVNFYKFLLGIGLTPNKSLTLSKIKVPEAYFKDFLRGVVDGDGCIQTWMHKSNYHIQWSLRITSGANEFSKWIKSETEKYFRVKGKIHTQAYANRNPIHIIKFGKLASKVILKEIYYPGCLSLHRKKLKAMECIETSSGFIKYGNVITIDQA
jgi:hypothetical protein